MKLSNLGEVNSLMQVRIKCEAALADMTTFVQNAEETDSGGTDGFDKGYNACISKHSDGSGHGADFAGCYVGVELGLSVLDILTNQIDRVDARLTELGLESIRENM